MSKHFKNKHLDYDVNSMSMEDLGNLPPYLDGYYHHGGDDKDSEDTTDSAPKTYKVFVYGTLLKDFGNNYLLATSKCLGTYRTKKKYKMLDLGAFPMVFKGQKIEKLEFLPPSARVAGFSLFRPVKGEVYEINEETLKRLDQLESNGRLYNRELIEIEDFDDGKCYMYLGVREFPRMTRVPLNLDREYSWKSYINDRYGT